VNSNLGNGITLGEQLDAALVESVVNDLGVILVALVDEVADDRAEDTVLGGEGFGVLRVNADDPRNRVNPVTLINVNPLVCVDA